MSWTIAEPGQVSSVGMTSPTPFPDLVGAKAPQVLGARIPGHHVQLAIEDDDAAAHAGED